MLGTRLKYAAFFKDIHVIQFINQRKVAKNSQQSKLIFVYKAV